jgi:ferredoxin-NADP reductase
VNNFYRVIEIQNLSIGNYIIKVEKRDLKFTAGQFFSLGLENNLINREYSVCSGENDSTVDFLIREINKGIISSNLRNIKINDKIKVLGPFGNFYLKKFDEKKQYIFIATGTGIAPFMSIIKTYPNTNYKIFHGVRLFEDTIKELIDKNYFTFVSREKCMGHNIYEGRITKYISLLNRFNKDTYFFLCGNSIMVSEVYDLLLKNNYSAINIFTEIFF